MRPRALSKAPDSEAGVEVTVEAEPGDDHAAPAFVGRDDDRLAISAHGEVELVLEGVLRDRQLGTRGEAVSRRPSAA